MPENLRFRRPEAGKEKRDIRPETTRRFSDLMARVFPDGLGDHDYIDHSSGRWIFASMYNQEFGLPETRRIVHEATAYSRLSMGEVRVNGVTSPVQVEYYMEVTINNEGLLTLGRPAREGFTENAETIYNSQLPQQTFVELTEVDLFARQVLEQYGFPSPSSEDQILPQNLHDQEQSFQDQALGLVHGSGDILGQRILSDAELNQAITYLERVVAEEQR